MWAVQPARAAARTLRRAHAASFSAAEASFSTAAAAPERPSLDATVRDVRSEEPHGKAGSRWSRKLRKEGQVPSVLYGIGEGGERHRTLITVPTDQVAAGVRNLGISLECCVVTLNLKSAAGEDLGAHKVVPRDVQLHPINNEPVSAGFVRWRPGRLVDVPIRFVNHDLAPGLKRGHLLVDRDSVRCYANNEDFPTSISHDLTGAEEGHVVRVRDLRVPPSLLPDGKLAPHIALASVHKKGG
jgi:large subunit ribosomal protein L25